jgi:hypothetical protein
VELWGEILYGCLAQLHHVSSKYKKEKADLIRKAEALDKKAEVQLQSSMEIDLKHYFKDRLAFDLRQEEVKWYQRAKTTRLLSGDCNTKYLYLVAIGKHRKTRIFFLSKMKAQLRVMKILRNLSLIIIKAFLGNQLRVISLLRSPL